MTQAVLTAADGAEWEATLISALSIATTGFSVSRRCLDVVELLAVAATGQAVAALVDAQLRNLDPDAVDRLAAAGVVTIGVTAAGSIGDAERLVACGVNFSVPANSSVEVFGTVIEAAIRDLHGVDSTSAERAFGDPAFATGNLHRSQVDSGVAFPSDHDATVVAVWGPTGAPGRTLVATNLADELARLGASTLFIDADMYGGVAASAFGLLDESPGLVAACRQAQARGLDSAALSALCWQISSNLRVLTGIARASRWPEIRPAAIEKVLEVSRQLAKFVVLDLGFSLETDEELSFDTLAPRRNGATLAALGVADLILVVGSADPIGMQRLVRGLDELRSIEVAAPIWVVLNRVRAGVVPGKPAVELEGALKRFAGRSPAALLPYDLATADRALIAGKMLAETTLGSPLRRAIAELAAAVSGIETPERGRRRRRRQNVGRS